MQISNLQAFATERMEGGDQSTRRLVYATSMVVDNTTLQFEGIAYQWKDGVARSYMQLQDEALMKLLKAVTLELARRATPLVAAPPATPSTAAPEPPAAA